jgi:hypothetical protein
MYVSALPRGATLKKAVTFMVLFVLFIVVLLLVLKAPDIISNLLLE